MVAFLAAQPRLVSVAHHVHSPAAVLEAARLGIPALVLVRDPEEAVLSTLVRYPYLTIRQALRGYARFYGPLVGRRGSFVAARFDDVVSDFGSVISRINAAFGTRFAEFDHSERNVQEALRTVDEWDRGAMDEGEELDRGQARPSVLREPLKAALRHRYEDDRLSRPRARAQRLYAVLTAQPGSEGAQY